MAEPETPPSPTAGTPHRPKRIECGFCECELSENGDYKELSARAKKLRGLEDDNDKLRRELASANGTIETLRADIEKLKEPKPEPEPEPKPEPKKKRFLFS